MKIFNKQARRDYQLMEHIEAGVVLNGAEVKAIRQNHASLDGSHVRLMNGEAYLVNAKIYPYKFAHDHTGSYEETRRRKLLLHRKEILTLKTRLDNGKGMALIPISLYIKNKRIKLEFAIGKGKKEYEKREDIKKRDLDRQMEQDLKRY